MSKRKEPSSPNEATGSKSARSAFEDEERALRSEIRMNEEQQVKLAKKKDVFMRKWSLEAEPVEKALAEARCRLDQLREDEERVLQTKIRTMKIHRALLAEEKEEEWRPEAEPVEKALAEAQGRLNRLRERCDPPVTEENASRLDKLPPELWEKIFCEFEDADLFPMALSCKFFRQKQKELVARKSELRMRTVFKRWGYTPYLSLSKDYILFACACALNTPLSDIQGQCAELRNGHAKIHAYFCEIAFYRHDYSLATALGFSRIDLNEEGRLRDMIVELSEEAVNSLPSEGWGLLKFLHESGKGWSADCIQMAAGSGHLELLKYAKENGISLGELEDLDHRDTCSSAAFGGNLEVLQWLRENGCPWNWRTCAKAVERGHFEILRWALENGCPWDVEQCYRLAGWRYDPQDFDPQGFASFSEYHEHMNIEWSKIQDWIDSTGRTLYADQAV